jgi:hypothetical protein
MEAIRVEPFLPDPTMKTKGVSGSVLAALGKRVFHAFTISGKRMWYLIFLEDSIMKFTSILRKI